MMLTALMCCWVASQAMSQKWVYLATNLLVDSNVESNISLLDRAKKAGYTGFVVTDSKFTRWDDLPDHYQLNAAKLRNHAREIGLSFVACVAPVGYSNDLLAGDPNLAEGLPVRRARFVVNDSNELIPLSDNAGLKNGGFESGQNNAPSGWSWTDAPGVSTFLDHETFAEGSTSLKMVDPIVGSPESGNCRACQTLKVRQFQNFHVSVKVKTENCSYASQLEVKTIGSDGRQLNYTTLKVASNTDWTPVDVTFNTLNNETVNLYLGVWGGSKGTVWWDDLKVEPAGFVNLVRRPGAPLKLSSADGTIDYVEGQDFEPIVDPKMGRIHWPGDFDGWHRQPIVNVKGSRLKPGTQVLADYYHTALIYDGQAMACLCEPKTMVLIQKNIQDVKKYLDPDGYMLSHDEIRMTGWDKSCEDSALSPGKILAKNTSDCIDFVKKTDPGKKIYAWSDMFDPNHNAQSQGLYYLVKGQGPWSGSWKGLSKDVTIFNWNSNSKVRSASLEFFEKLGCQQILAGYYDGPVNNFSDWWKDAHGVRGVQGAMYTTWINNYADLEPFSQVLVGGQR